jgi:hypothetical protein
MSNAEDRLRQEAMGFRNTLPRRREPTDITEAFTTAAGKLETGQLVKDEWFTLYESVGALEVCKKALHDFYTH